MIVLQNRWKKWPSLNVKKLNDPAYYYNQNMNTSLMPYSYHFIQRHLILGRFEFWAPTLEWLFDLGVEQNDVGRLKREQLNMLS